MTRSRTKKLATRCARLALASLTIAGCAAGGHSAGRQPTATTSGSRHHAPRHGGIQAFGTAAEGAERAAISALIRSYLAAQGADDGSAMCSRLAAELRAEVQALEAQGATRRRKGCAQPLAAVYAHQPPPGARRVVITDIRVSGGRAFAIFHLPAMPTEFYPLQLEQGKWKIGALGPTVLPPQH